MKHHRERPMTPLTIVIRGGALLTGCTVAWATILLALAP